VQHRPNNLFVRRGCAFILAVSDYQTRKTKAEIYPFKTDENEMKTHNIVAMFFALCLCGYFSDLRFAPVMFSK